MIDVIEKQDCTGCKMCADICPKKAIEFKVDDEGFWYPKVDYSVCVKCGGCVKNCPSINEKNIQQKEAEVYSAWSKDEKTRITSTSGGAFWVIAKEFINRGGFVVGCRYSEDWKSARHIIAHNEQELELVKGSKYFQSDTEGIYDEVKRELTKGNKVLFCGTPCQIAAIKAFLNIEYDNLYCLDFICRSINSPKAFAAYITELEEEYNSKVVEVHLKNKKYGWQSLASQVRFANGEETIRDKNQDWWVKGFIFNDLYTRESCYNCKYKVLPRLNADISIGDFWGIQNQSKKDMFEGISVLLVNSEKGKQLLEHCKDNFELKRYQMSDVLPGNPALLNNPVRTSKQRKFFQLLNKQSFSYSVRKCIKVSLFDRVKQKIKKLLKLGIKIIRILKEGKISISKYIYYNYFCKNIVREGSAKIIPYKGTIMQLAPSARIYLKGKDLEITANKLKKSKSETHIRMDENAVWRCNNGAYLFYNTVVEIKENAILETGYFSANGGSVIIADKHIEFGEDVMIGRNVIVYDSDFHCILDDEGRAVNQPQKVKVENHVWLTTNVMVQKGVTIGRDSLVSAYTVVNKDMPENCIIGGKSVGKVLKEEVRWNRKRCSR